MDTKIVKTFLCVAELGNFTKAAEKLGYVQSTVTVQVQQLEQELGYPLFDRIGKKVALTSFGKEFLPFAYEMLHIMQKATSLGTSPSQIRGTLRIGALETLLDSNMPLILSSYKWQYPLVDIELKMGRTIDLLELLKQNQLDMLYVCEDINADPELYCCYKRREQLIFITSPEHELAKQKNVSLREIFEHTLIVTEQSGIVYKRLKNLAIREGMKLHHSFIVDSSVAIIRMVTKNLGIAFLPEYSVINQIQDGQLAKINVDMPPQTYYSQILYHTSKWVAPFAEGLVDIIRTSFPEK
ncbi:LysR family transcriptional regulator [Oscillibacter sp. MSJ-2]|uniref:LysR family transcriptional regulator n=1 Tax=Dysosmobacter acutus TaxID=2841504 RepID=A0ABS6FBR8_9FIRM|nr:LysR family transcriptional regulator [Dysosmobacter acutus]MBU5626830.1 LysR family transcriptional regulator [Dysosmobacter acutus]